MFARRSFLAAALSLATLPFLRRLPWPRKRKPCCETGCGSQGESFAWEQHFQVPVWPREETQGADNETLAKLALFHALDILSSPASEEERHLRAEQIKRHNPDLHARLLRELAAIDAGIERVTLPDFKDGFGGQVRGYDPQIGTSFRFDYRQLTYRLHRTSGECYMGGASHLSISATEQFGRQGEGSDYWIDTPQGQAHARRALDRLTGPLQSTELASQVKQFREVLGNVV